MLLYCTTLLNQYFVIHPSVPSVGLHTPENPLFDLRLLPLRVSIVLLQVLNKLSYQYFVKHSTSPSEHHACADPTPPSFPSSRPVREGGRREGRREGRGGEREAAKEVGR